jgi:hypothetical protein
MLPSISCSADPLRAYLLALLHVGYFRSASPERVRRTSTPEAVWFGIADTKIEYIVGILQQSWQFQKHGFRRPLEISRAYQMRRATTSQQIFIGGHGFKTFISNQ